MKIKKILLILPNINILTPDIFPMELGLLSSIVKQHGYGTRLIVVNTMKKLREFSRILHEYEPDMVGFASISSQAMYAVEMAEKVKAWRDIPVIIGGKHASIAPDMLMDNPLLDAVIVGEGEHAIIEILQALEAGRDFVGIKNVWFRRPDGEVIKNEQHPFIDLDTLPYLDYTALDYQAILNRNYKTVTFMTGRGCPWDCTFCGVPMLKKTGSGAFCRLRSHEHIFGEFAYLQQHYDFNYIYFRDDTFTWNREWTMTFCKEWPQRFPYHFEILTRADCLDEEMLRALKKAGCDCIWIGADSGNDYIREEILKKNVDNEQLIQVCEYMQEIGIRPCLTNMIGLPHETPEHFQDTIKLNARIYGKKNLNISAGNGPLPKIFTFSPFPGTPLWNLCNEEGWLKNIPHGFKTYEDAYIEMPQFPLKKIYRMKRDFRYLVYKDSHYGYALFMRLLDSAFGRFLAQRVAIAHYPFNALMKLLSMWTEKSEK